MRDQDFLMATGFELTAAALRDQPDKVRHLFGALTAAETAAAAEGSILAMAEMIRAVLDPDVIEQMSTAAEAGAILAASGADTEGTTP